MNPILSIIIPFYGTADKTLLERCLNSIRTQNISQEQIDCGFEANPRVY